MSVNVKWISIEELFALTDSEGLIIQRLGGDLDKWIDTFNWLLTVAHVLKDGTEFHNCLACQCDGWNCLLLPFGKDVSINIEELEKWRDKTAELFHAILLSAFINDHSADSFKQEHPMIK
jgi:hypothetical protein